MEASLYLIAPADKDGKLLGDWKFSPNVWVPSELSHGVVGCAAFKYTMYSETEYAPLVPRPINLTEDVTLHLQVLN